MRRPKREALDISHMYIDRGTSDTSYSRALSYMISTMGTHQKNNLNGIRSVSIDKNLKDFVKTGVLCSYEFK